MAFISTNAQKNIRNEDNLTFVNFAGATACYHLCFHVMLSFWDDNTPLFNFPKNFTHSAPKKTFEL